MPFLMITSLLLLFAVAMMQISKQKFTYCLPLVCFLIIISSYLLAVLGGLWLAPWLLRGLAVTALLYCIYAFFKTKTLTVREVGFAMMAFCVFAALLWWICRGRMFFDWDEFSHWGSSVKIMYYSDALYSAPASSDLFKSYPPALALLQYVLLKTLGLPFREDAVMLSGALLSASMLLYPLGAISAKKRPVGALLSCAVLVLAPAVATDHPYYQVAVEMPMGILVAFLLLVTFLPGKTESRLFLVNMGCFVLTLLKGTGAGLAVLCCCVVMPVLCKELAGLEQLQQKRALRSLLAVSPLLAVAAAKLSWKLYLAAVGVAERWQVQTTVGDIWSLLTGRSIGYRAKVLTKFKTDFFITGAYGPGQFASPVCWVLVPLLAGVLVCLLRPKNERKRICIAFAGSAGLFLAFVVSLLASYLFAFDPEEAVVLASFYRYLSSLITSMVVFAAGMLCWALCAAEKKSLQFTLAVLAVALVLPFATSRNFVTLLLNAPTAAAQTHHDRYLYQRTAAYIRQLGQSDPLLYLITANDAGKTQLIVGYELLPQTLPEQATIIAAEPSKEPWVKQYSAEEWSQLLAKEYDYVYIHCPEDQFVRDYISVFEDESQVVVDRMFEVVQQPDGTAKLRRIMMEPVQ